MSAMNTSFPDLQTQKYIILKPNDLNLPHLEKAEIIPIPNGDKSYVFVELTPEQFAAIDKLLQKTNGSIFKNQEHTFKEDLDVAHEAAIKPDEAKKIAASAASIYLTNKKRCDNCNTKSAERPTIFIIMDGRINPNKKNKNGKKVFAGLNIEIGPRFAPDDPGPCIDHGNQVLSLYCGKQNSGMIPNCNNVVDKIVTVEVFSCKSGKTNTEDIIKSWLWVADYTLKHRDKYNIVVNESIDALSKLNAGSEDAIAAAVNAGALVFFPSGNSGGDKCNYSPNLMVPGTFIAGGTTNGNWVDFYSNWGKCVKSYFPFQVTDYNNKAIKGTSFSVPFAGVLALCILGKNPHLTKDELFAAILSRMTTIDPERWHNYDLPTRITEKAKFCELPLYKSKKDKLCWELTTPPGEPRSQSRNEVCVPTAARK